MKDGMVISEVSDGKAPKYYRRQLQGGLAEWYGSQEVDRGVTRAWEGAQRVAPSHQGAHTFPQPHSPQLSIVHYFKHAFRYDSGTKNIWQDVTLQQVTLSFSS